MPYTLIDLTGDIVTAYVGNNSVEVKDIHAVISAVHRSLQEIEKKPAAVEPPKSLNPAVPVRKSVQPDFLICLEDGVKVKMLKRHLKTHFNLTPEEYRVKWGLPPEYPMVAPNYARVRSEFAKKNGLGQRR